MAGTYDTVCTDPRTGAEVIYNRAGISLDGVDLEGNRASSGSGGAVAVSLGPSYEGARRLAARFMRVSARGNRAATSGGAVFAGGGTELALASSHLSGNAADFGSGGAVALEGTVSADLADTVLVGNACGGSGGGLAGLGAAAVAITGGDVVSAWSAAVSADSAAAVAAAHPMLLYI